MRVNEKVITVIVHFTVYETLTYIGTVFATFHSYINIIRSKNRHVTGLETRGAVSLKSY